MINKNISQNSQTEGRSWRTKETCTNYVPNFTLHKDERFWREIPTWCNNLFIIINNSTCFGHLYMSRIQNLHQCTRLHTGSSEPQPQHLALDTLWSSIIRTQLNTPEDGHIDARNMYSFL